MESCSNNCMHSWKGFTEDVHQVVLFTVLSFKWSKKKHNLAKILLETCTNFTIISFKNKCKFHSYKYSYILVFILFFLRIKFSASWWSKNKKYFCILFLYFSGMPNSIDFYQGIFLYAFPVPISFMNPIDFYLNFDL